MQAPNPQTPSLLGICNTNTHTCDFKTPLKGFESPYMLILYTTSTIPNLEIFQEITPVEDLRELLGIKP